MNPCSKDDSTEIRSVIFGLKKSIQIATFTIKQVNDVTRVCELFPCIPLPFSGCTDAPEKVCKIVPTFLAKVLGIVLFSLQVLVDISERIFFEKCGRPVKTSNYDLLRQDAIYDNVITIARNGITVSFVLLIRCQMMDANSIYPLSFLKN